MSFALDFQASLAQASMAEVRSRNARVGQIAQMSRARCEHQNEVKQMPLDPSLAGHETQPETGTIAAVDVRAFADAIGDASAIFREEAAATTAGYAHIPATPTFVTRFRVPFEEAGLDVQKTQVLHGEQEYTYTRPLYVGDALEVRHVIASIRQSGRGGMAIMTLEQH